MSDHDVRVPFPNESKLNLHYGEVTKIDLEAKLVHLANSEPVSYDQLVIGLGCEDKYHNIPGADLYTYSIQSIGKARDTYQKLNNLSANSIVSIVGGGLSGIELASELRESRPDLAIKLFDRGKTVLSSFPERISLYVQNWFASNGVEVINEANITKVEEGVLYNNDQPCFNRCDCLDSWNPTK